MFLNRTKMKHGIENKISKNYNKIIKVNKI